MQKKPSVLSYTIDPIQVTRDIEHETHEISRLRLVRNDDKIKINCAEKQIGELRTDSVGARVHVWRSITGILLHQFKLGTKLCAVALCRFLSFTSRTATRWVLNQSYRFEFRSTTELRIAFQTRSPRWIFEARTLLLFIVVDANFMYRITFVKLAGTWMLMRWIYSFVRDKNASDFIDFVKLLWSTRATWLVDKRKAFILHFRARQAQHETCEKCCTPHISITRNLQWPSKNDDTIGASRAHCGAYLHRHDSELHRIENNCRYPCILPDIDDDGCLLRLGWSAWSAYAGCSHNFNKEKSIPSVHNVFLVYLLFSIPFFYLIFFSFRSILSHARSATDKMNWNSFFSRFYHPFDGLVIRQTNFVRQLNILCDGGNRVCALCDRNTQSFKFFVAR